MTFIYKTHQGSHVREYLDLAVYHITTIPQKSIFASTANLENAEYFLKNKYGTYIDLVAIFPSYGTSFEDAAELYLTKQQHVPEALL